MSNDVRITPELRQGLQDATLALNGGITDSAVMTRLSNFIYALILRRGRLLYSRSAGVGNFASGTTHRARIFPGYSYASTYCTVVYSDSGTAGSAGFATFNVGGVAQAPPNPANSTVVAGGPSDFRVTMFALNMSGSSNADGSFDFDWSVSANSAIVAVLVYQGVVNSTSTLNTLPTSAFHTGSPVIANYMLGPHTEAWSMFKQGTTTHFGWSGSASVIGATYANVLDASTAGYSSAAAGFWAIPYRQASLTETTVACTFWCYASSDGTTGRVRLQNSTGVLGTITGIGAAGYYTATISLDPTITTSDLLIVEASEATAGKTVTVRGAGLWSVHA